MATPTEQMQPAAEDRSRTGQLVLVVVGVLVLLALLWYFFLRSDDDAVDTAAPVPAPVTTPAEDEEESEAEGRPNQVETFEVFAPKDPFEPLVAPDVGGDAAAAPEGTATVIEGGTTTTGATTTTTTGGTTTTTTTTSGGGGGGESVGGHRVRVIDVFTEGGNRRAQVQVDGTVYTVDEGETFADNFQLLSTSGRCATMLFGDDEFTLCEGEEILK